MVMTCNERVNKNKINTLAVSERRSLGDTSYAFLEGKIGQTDHNEPFIA